MLPLNLDCGEVEGDHLLLIPKNKFTISYCNIACGQHAGYNKTITEAIKTALDQNIKIGAHPSYPDKDNFGRVTMIIEESKLIQSIVDQLNFLKTITDTFGIKLNHVKAHGALYNDAAEDPKIANAFLDAIRIFDKGLKIFTLPHSTLYNLGVKRGFDMVKEGFGDRVYVDETSLQSRDIEGALIQDLTKISEQINCLNIGYVVSHTGNRISIEVDTVCIHGDNPCFRI